MNPWSEKIRFYAKQNPESLAFWDESLTFSYVNLQSATKQIAEQLTSNGLRHRDRVIVILPRSATAAVILTSLLEYNFTGLFLDTKTNPVELIKIIEKIQPHAIIATQLNSLYQVRHVEDLDVQASPWMKPRLFIPTKSPSNQKFHPDLCWLLGTSGSTGEIKAVMLSQENLTYRTKGEIRDFQLSSDHLQLNVLPFSHDLGLNQILTTLWLGSSLKIKSRSVAKLAVYLVEKNVAGITGTPLLWLDFLKTHQHDITFPHIQFITISGGTLEKSKVFLLKNIFPNARILKTYGQTETFRTFINSDITSDNLGSLVKEAQIRITSQNELIHYGPTSMLGYLFDPELSQQRIIFSEDFGHGVYTRDLIEPKGHNEYKIVGRLDDVIKRFEQRFHLSEVENIFKNLKGVLDAVAITVAAPVTDWRQFYLGVFIRLQQDSTLTEQQLRQYAQQQLSYHKIPDYIKIIEHFPTTSSHKVDRLQLAEEMKEGKESYVRSGSQF